MLGPRFRAVLGTGAVVLASGVAIVPGSSTVATAMAAPRPVAVRHSDQRSSLPLSWSSGVFAGFSAPRAQAFGTWRGRPITSATDFDSSLSWFALERSTRLIQTWRGNNKGLKLSISVPLWPGTGNDMRAAASGYYDNRFKQMAKALVAAGLGHSILRLGWEFNGRWFPWGITHGRLYDTASATRAQQRSLRAEEFVRAWRHIVRAIRTVPGAHFQFDWCVSAGPHYRHVALAYPGNRYVDYIGDDVYDWNRDGYRSAERRWRQIVDERTGLAWQERFARRHHKPMSFPEWALVADLFQPAASGNDDPSFIRHMHQWFSHHDVAYEDYFDFDPSLGLSSALNTGNGRFNLAGQIYRLLWGR